MPNQEAPNILFDLFEAALTQTPENREAWLAEVCEGDESLRAKLERMLAADERKGPLDQALEIDSSVVSGEFTPQSHQKIGHYRVLEKLGHGGMGVVYKARDERLNRYVALKFLTASHARNEAARERVFREARAVSTLDHPNICTIYDVGEAAAGELFIAMAYYEGETLASRITRSQLAVEECVDIAEQVARGLDCAHEAGVVHRDVKPSNLMLTLRGEVKILDFGIAKSMDATTRTLEERAATLVYAAPEQVQGQETDYRADIWSLGVVLYEMLTGQLPFRGRSDFEIMEAILRGVPERPSKHRPDLPVALEGVVIRALEKDPALRFSSAGDMARALREQAEPAASDLYRVPVPMTTFVGRGQELDRVEGLLRGARLVTLTGPAGTGKTRLSLETAKRVAPLYREGAVFVPLASARDSDAVVEELMTSLRVPPASVRPALDQLVDFLSRREILLILDNFEQVTMAAPVVARLLQSAPALKVLVTSRVPLRVSGEHEFAVPPLDVAGLAGGRASAALQLFSDRARAILPDFVVNEQNRESIVEICNRLDGLPLAIELAAARIKVLSPQSIAARLSKRLELLRSGARDLPSRHQTLRQALDWSHALLSDAEKRVFRRCAVFAGAFSLQAIEQVCAQFQDVEEPVLDVVSSLLDHSLLVRRESADGELRLLLLETIREYSCEQLKEAGEEEAALQAHLEQFRLLAVETDEAVTGGAPQKQWLARVEAWHEDIRAGLAWLEKRGRISDALEICAGVWRFWMARGYLVAGREHMERLLLQAPTDLNPDLRARVLNGCGTLAHGACDMQGARQLLEEALALFRQSGNSRGIALALNNLAWIDIELNDFSSARQMADEAYRLFEGLGDKRGLGVALNNLGWIENFQCRFDAARRCHTRSIELRQAAGDLRGSAFGLSNLAWVEQRTGNYELALSLVGEAQRILDGMGDPLLEAWALQIESAVFCEQGRYAETLALTDRSRTIWRRVGNATGLSGACFYAAIAYVGSGQMEAATKAVEEGLRGITKMPQDWAHGQLWFAKALISAQTAYPDAASEEVREALGMLTAIDDRRSAADCLELLASLLAVENPSEARTHLASASQIRKDIGVPTPPCFRNRLERTKNHLAV